MKQLAWLLLFFPLQAEQVYADRLALKSGISNGIKESLFMQSSFLTDEQRRDFATLFIAAQSSFDAQDERFTAPKNIYKEGVTAFKRGDYKKSEELFGLSATYLDRIPVSPLEAIQKAIAMQRGDAPQEKVIMAGREFLNTVLEESDECQIPLEEALKPFHLGLQYAKKGGTPYKEESLKLWEETEDFFLHPKPPPKAPDNRTVEELREMNLLDETPKLPSENEGRGLKPW